MKMGGNKLLLYFLVDFIPILVVLVLLPVLFGFVLYCSQRRWKKLKDYVVLIMEKYFKQVGKKESKTAKEMSKLSSEIDISEVNFDDVRIYGIFLFATCFSLIYVAAQLWDAFSVRVQQDNCVDTLDCYLFDGRRNILNQRPLNCTDFAGDLAGDLVDSDFASFATSSSSIIIRS